ncbi:hypothetical protein STRTUCAR8_07362 [Streptomyces turgidiscabies Car8]|uniref:Uncharacterized protein n=1 Tax=Streptomyces turgidiscabies (strain Car8) TaxID=698760 RepID=L7F6D6_STRT8|nr:hypothetical protein STRTUCAR8_07362 [Streptomyces turgidiscabies Car8]
MTTLVRRPDTLTRDALTVLQPGFTGTTAPDWLLRRLGEGLASVGCRPQHRIPHPTGRPHRPVARRT